jgi:hypothetical protein
VLLGHDLQGPNFEHLLVRLSGRRHPVLMLLTQSAAGVTDS